jgi:outer membrane receptor protein involved in Fe transport
MGSSLFCASSIMAQDTTATAAETNTDEEIVYLSPFEVTSEGSIGYQAKDTLAGTRLRTDLKDVANAIQVVNSQFLQDTGATNTKSLLIYTTNTEVGGIGGNFGNVGESGTPDDQANRVSPQTNTRVRGLGSADNTRDFFLTRLPWDSYNVDRVDIQRGPNSILFGIGSPAGMVNTNTKGATMFNEGKVEARIGSYGSIRGSVNVNRVLLDGQLAVRIAALYNDEEYRQRPAFSTDKRVFAALRYEPNWAKIGSSKFTLTANYENGDIEANRPRTTAPVDKITDWYTNLDQRTYNNGIVNSTTASQDDGSYSYGAIVTGSANYSPYLQYWGADYYGPVYVYDDVNSSSWSSIEQGSSTQVANDPDNTIATPDYNYIYGFGIAGTGNYATAAKLDGYTIGAWRNTTLTDTNIFDFYDNLLDGDTKRELESWDSFNVTATETLWDNLLSFNVSYDYQKDEQSYKSRIDNQGGYAICVDVSDYLSDGSVNPNVGRAYVASRSYGYSDVEMRNTVRGIAVLDIDLKKYYDPDSWLVRILGRNTFNANISHMIVNTQHRGWEGLTSGTGFYDSKAISEGAREVATLSYLSGDLRTTSLGENLNLSRIKASRNPTDGTTNLYDGTSYVSTAFDVWSDANSDDMDNLYLGANCYDNKTITDSWGVIWNGYLFDNLIVPTVGYRSDTQKFFSSGTATLNSQNSIANFNDPDWYVPTSLSDANDTDLYGNRISQKVSGDSTSWGVVVHTPEFIKKALPAGIDVSLFYNDSDNFRPDASRVDLYGDPIASETGSTKEYGIVISALDDRITLKINKYETKDNNTNIGNAITNYYMLGMGEGWSYMYMLQAVNHLNDFSTDRRSDTTVGTYQAWTGVQDENGVNLTDAQTQAFFEEVASAWFNLSYDTDGNISGIESNNETYYPSEKFQRAWFSGTTFNEWLTEYKNGTATSWWGYITSGSANMKVTGDTESKGYEFELTAQITPEWNVAINASKTDAMRLNLAQSYIDYTEERWAAYETNYGQALLWGPWWSSGNVLKNKWTSEYYGNYLLQRALEGSNVAELCKWHLNLVTNYTFSEGTLKGLNVGGGYRWQDKVTIGYPLLYDDAGELALDAKGNAQYDINNPWKGDIEQYFDLWIGYEHPINDDVTWKIQLNVKNVGVGDKLIPVTVNPADKDGDGVYESYSVATSRIAESMTWYLTNTFTF